MITLSFVSIGRREEDMVWEILYNHDGHGTLGIAWNMISRGGDLRKY